MKDKEPQAKPDETTEGAPADHSELNESEPRQQNKKKESASEKPEKGSFQEKRTERSEENDTLVNRLTEFTSSALKFARKTTGTSLKVGKAFMRSQDQLKLMVAAGESLRDLREVAGLTINELSDALNLKDKTLLEAVENGTATLSFELILRLSALLARNDPIPFILKFTRTYNPEIWAILNDWGLGRIPLQFERERKFMNIYRSHDAARKLSDEGFEKVLEFTRKAFELSLHFIAEQEKVQAAENRSAEEILAEELKRQKAEIRKNSSEKKNAPEK